MEDATLRSWSDGTHLRQAVRAQLENGVTFSLSHPVEVEVAERLIEAVPLSDVSASFVMEAIKDTTELPVT